MKLNRMLLSIFILLPFAALIIVNIQPVEAQGWLEGWGYRKSHVINGVAGAGNGYQIRITVHYGSGTDSGENVYLNEHCKADFGDIRFADDDGTTLLSYWMESYTNASQAVFWVKVNDDLNTNPATIYIYYGNLEATYGDDFSHGTSTFPFYDNFNDGLINTTLWTTYRQSTTYIVISESGGLGRIQGKSNGVGYWGYWRSKSTYSANYAVRSRQYWYRYNVMNSHYRTGFGDADKTGTGSNGIIRRASRSWTNPEYNYFLTKVDGTTYQTALAQNTLNLWRIFEIRRNGEYVESVLDDSSEIIVTDPAQIPTTELYAGFWLWAGANSGSIELRVDWFFVRKYVYPEPSHGGWGGEQTPGQGDNPYPPTLNSPANNTRSNPSAAVNFSWIFSHPNSSEYQSAYQLQLDNDSDFSSPELDTGKVQSSASWTVRDLPSSFTLYYWRVRVWDSQDFASDYSAAFVLVVDRLEVYGAWVSDERADVGSTQQVYWQLRYDFDDAVFTSSDGSVYIDGESAFWDSANSRWYINTSKSAVGSYVYQLTFVDNTWGLTDITGTTSQTIIWDRIQICEGGVTDSRCDVGSIVYVWFKARYEYDQAVFDSNNALYINGSLASWDGLRWVKAFSSSNVSKLVFAVTSVVDNHYGLSAFKMDVDLPYAIFDKVVFTLSVADDRINIGSSASVSISGVYVYDGASFQGYYRLNDTELAKSEAGRYAFTVMGISDSLYGLTVFESNTVQVIWDGLAIYSQAVDLEKGFVSVLVKYTYDDQPVNGCRVSYGGAYAYTNGSGWATFQIRNLSRMLYGSEAYALEEPLYGLTLCSQSLAIQFAKEVADTCWVASQSAISSFFYDYVNRKLSFHTSAIAVVYVAGMGTPQSVQVNRKTWSDWTYSDGYIKIYNLSSYVIISWAAPPAQEEPQPPQYISIFSMGVGVADLGRIEPDSTVNFTIPIHCNQTAKIVNVEFQLKSEWFTILDKLPFDITKGNSTLKVQLKTPANVQGVYSIPVSITGMIEGTSLTANSYVKFTVETARETGVLEQFLVYLGDPLIIFLILMTVLIVAASRRRQ